jgi:hypothetical protein
MKAGNPRLRPNGAWDDTTILALQHRTMMFLTSSLRVLVRFALVERASERNPSQYSKILFSSVWVEDDEPCFNRLRRSLNGRMPPLLCKGISKKAISRC